MTTIAMKRCLHCGDTYKYVSSTYGGSLPANQNPDYCSLCWEVARTALAEALSKIPKKYEIVWEPTQGVALEALLAENKRLDDEANATGRLRIRRVSFPLFHIPEKGIEAMTKDHSGYIRYQGLEYHYRYWDGKESAAEITVKMERNLQTGELLPVRWT